MNGLYESLITIILFGINFVNTVQLYSTNENGMDSLFYIIINIILWALLIFILVKKYNVIKFTQVKILVAIPIFYLNYITINDFINRSIELNSESLFLVFLSMLFLDVSLFFELSD